MVIAGRLIKHRAEKRYFSKWGVVGGLMMLFSSLSFALEQRIHIKCHLQTEDQQARIEQFVITNGSKTQFINRLAEQSVFMSDGRSKQQIATVYECVDLNGRFSSEEARSLERGSPR